MRRIIRRNKLLVAILAITLLSSSAYMVTRKNPTDKEFIFQAGFKNIPEFKNWEKNSDRKFWANKGYNFLTFSEMDQLIKSNGFIISDPINYIGSIPDTIQSVIRKNYKKLSKYELKYTIRKPFSSGSSTGFFCDKDLAWDLRGETWEEDNDHLIDRLGFWVSDDALVEQGISTDETDWVLEKNLLNAGMKIVAHHSNFVAGTTSDPAILLMPVKPDPMVVMKQRNGYVVLAHWQ